MMEYKIANKMQSILGHFAGFKLPEKSQKKIKKINRERMKTVLVHTGTGQIIQVSKETVFLEWHKKLVSISIADADDPTSIVKATFDSKEKLEALIKLLEHHKSTFEDFV